jgi:hypothetical protein
MESLNRVRKNGLDLGFVQEDLIDEKLCLEAIAQNGCALQYVPENLVNYEMCLMAVKKRGYALRYVPEHFINKYLCSIAVDMETSALKYVPHDLRDKEMCLGAIKRDPRALYDVPLDLGFEDRKEMCMITQTHKYFGSYIPVDLANDEQICTYAIQKRGWRAMFVPQNMKELIFEKWITSARLSLKNMGTIKPEYTLPDEMIQCICECMCATRYNKETMEWGFILAEMRGKWPSTCCFYF